MKRIGIILATLVLAVVAGCAATLHKPTTPGNAGTSALVAYAAAGFTAGRYLRMELCATPPVYPCKTKSVNDRLVEADKAAYLAAKAADAAGNPAQAAPQIGALKAINASPDVASQLALIEGDAP